MRGDKEQCDDELGPTAQSLSSLTPILSAAYSARHRLEEKNCRGGLEAVLFGEDWQFACVDESTKTMYKSCHLTESREI